MRRERSISGQKHLYPLYTSQEHHGGGIQYIPFDDPRIRHISSALGGNSLTDADKIRHICNELPSVAVSEPSSINSAFLPPPLAPSIAAKLAADANRTSCGNLDNDSDRWHSDLHNETIDNFPAIDQNCNSRCPKNRRPPSSPSSACQAPIARISSHQGPILDQVFAETITQVKKIVPDSGTENNSNTKRRVSETIFCLVSVPVHTPTNINKDLAADQNNNETIPGLTVTADTFAVGLKESLNVRSKSVNEMPVKSRYSRFHASGTSSLRNYKRAPLRKEIIDAWILQANEDKQLCYAGSWPGNQYRNQETQTGSPLTVLKSPESQSPPAGQEPPQSVSGTTTESDPSTEKCSSYGYPMAGQKNLQLSSNSAFSRLNLSPTQLSLTEGPREAPSPPSFPSDRENQRDQQLSSATGAHSSPLDSAEQVAFGQFLLKPMNRRPHDAIGELESINKEMEDTISKRATLAKHRDGLNGLSDRFRHFTSGSRFTVGLELGREAVSLPPMHTDTPSNRKVRSRSFASAADLAFMDAEFVFAKPQTNSVPPSNEACQLKNQGASAGCLLPLCSPQNGLNQLYRQDIPVPQESLLKDVGLTVYTETPGGPGEPMKRSLSVPSPQDSQELFQSSQELCENRREHVQNISSTNDCSNKEVLAMPQTERTAESSSDVPSSGRVTLRIRRSQSENSQQKDTSSPITKMRKEACFVFFKNNTDEERTTLSEPLIYKNESTIADEHLQNLLTLEKANSLPAQDLSSLYEVQWARGIPENESIEQRAARILGISVPVEALGVGEKQSDDKRGGGDDGDGVTVSSRTPPEDMARAMKQVRQFTGEKKVNKTEAKENGEEEVRHKRHNNNDDSEKQDAEVPSLPVLELPEFPPSQLPLSLPVTPTEKLVLGTCTAEKRARGGTCKTIESLQDKLHCSTPAASLSRSATDRMARLKELGSVSRIRQLSLKGSQSEERDDGKSASGAQKPKDELVDGSKAERETEDKEEVAEQESAPLGYRDAWTSKETNIETEQTGEEEAREVGETPASASENRGIAKVEVDFKPEKAEGVVEPSLVEDNKEKPVKKEGDKTAKVPRVQEAAGEAVPKPRQRTKLQKPPLLPKPRSVPKREIRLPPGISASGLAGEDDRSASGAWTVQKNPSFFPTLSSPLACDTRFSFFFSYFCVRCMIQMKFCKCTFL